MLLHKTLAIIVSLESLPQPNSFITNTVVQLKKDFNKETKRDDEDVSLRMDLILALFRLSQLQHNKLVILPETTNRAIQELCAAFFNSFGELKIFAEFLYQQRKNITFFSPEGSKAAMSLVMHVARENVAAANVFLREPNIFLSRFNDIFLMRLLIMHRHDANFFADLTARFKQLKKTHITMGIKYLSAALILFKETNRYTQHMSAKHLAQIFEAHLNKIVLVVQNCPEVGSMNQALLSRCLFLVLNNLFLARTSIQSFAELYQDRYAARIFNSHSQLKALLEIENESRGKEDFFANSTLLVQTIATTLNKQLDADESLLEDSPEPVLNIQTVTESLPGSNRKPASTSSLVPRYARAALVRSNASLYSSSDTQSASSPEDSNASSSYQPNA